LDIVYITPPTYSNQIAQIPMTSKGSISYIERANEIIEEGEWSKFVSDDWKYSFEISLKGLLTSLLNEKDDIIITWRRYLERVLEKFSFKNFVFNPDLGMQTSSFPTHIDLEFRNHGSNISSHGLAQALGLLIQVMEDKLQLIKGDKKHKRIIEFLDKESGFFGKLVKLIQYLNSWSEEKMTFQEYLNTRQRHTELVAKLRHVMGEFETNPSIQNSVGQRRITEILKQIELVEIREIYGGDTLTF
jgi:hypothetical protein